MSGVSPLELLADLQIAAVPEVPQILRNLNRSPVWRETLECYRYSICNENPCGRIIELLHSRAKHRAAIGLVANPRTSTAGKIDPFRGAEIQHRGLLGREPLTQNWHDRPILDFLVADSSVTDLFHQQLPLFVPNGRNFVFGKMMGHEVAPGDPPLYLDVPLFENQ